MLDYTEGDIESRQAAIDTVVDLKFKTSKNTTDPEADGDIRYKVLNGIAGENGLVYDKVVQPGTVAFENLKRNRKEYEIRRYI